MPGKTVVILGGGVGGLVTAKELRKRLGKEHRVVLVDKGGEHIFWPSLLWVQVGLRDPYKIMRDLARLEKKGIDVVKGQVESIDPEQRTVRVNENELESDYLVISLGADLAPEQVPGLEDAGFNLYSMEGAVAIRDARADLIEGRLVVLTARVPYKCPAAPYEAAMLLESDLRKRKVRDRVEVSIYAAEPAPMGVAGPEASQGVRQLVEERNIIYYPQHQVSEVDSTSRTLRFTNGAEAHYEFLVYIPPHVAPKVVKDAGLTGESGWVPVDRHTMETSFPGVYAIGDVTGIPLGVGQPLPKAGVFAHGQAEVVAHNISVEIKGRGKVKEWDGQGSCFLEVGQGKSAFVKGWFLAEPKPEIEFHMPGRVWHMQKFIFEKYWMHHWF